STSKQPLQEEEEETDEEEERGADQEENGETHQEEDGEEYESGSWKPMEQSSDSDPTEWEITHSLCDNDDNNTNGLNQLSGAILTNSKEKESIDFSNTSEWYNIKVLAASKIIRDSVKGKIKGKTTSNTAADDTEEDARPWSRKEPISLRTQIDTT
ncbi:hypothetical protein BGZ49_006385, partial [Haplosporangium sp. Z 27]